MDWICPNLRGGAAQPAAPGHPPLQGRGNGAEGGRAAPRWRGGRSPGAQGTGTRRRDGQRPGGVGGVRRHQVLQGRGGRALQGTHRPKQLCSAFLVTLKVMFPTHRG